MGRSELPIPAVAAAGQLMLLLVVQLILLPAVAAAGFFQELEVLEKELRVQVEVQEVQARRLVRTVLAVAAGQVPWGVMPQQIRREPEGQGVQPKQVRTVRVEQVRVLAVAAGHLREQVETD